MFSKIFLNRSLLQSQSFLLQIPLSKLHTQSLEVCRTICAASFAARQHSKRAQLNWIHSKLQSFENSTMSDKGTGKRKAESSTDEENGKPEAKKSCQESTESFQEKIKMSRLSVCKSVAEFKFKFNKKRVRLLSKVLDCPDEANGIVYWMSRDQRVQDNWAFLYAQKLALKMEVPLHVCFCLVPKFLDATIRHYTFLLEGLKEVEKECRELDIAFHLLTGHAKDVLPSFIEEHKIGALVTDFSPLRVPAAWVKDVSKAIPKDIAFCQEVDWAVAYKSLEVDQSVPPVDWATPGTSGGLKVLESFCKERLKYFNADRNNPNKNALSNLSPWIHFGQLSVQRCIIVVKQYRSKSSESVEAFIEEAIIRRELADNFCYYNEHL